MNAFLESMNPLHAQILTWSITAVAGLLALALAVHPCGMKPPLRFSLLAVLVGGGLTLVLVTNPGNRGSVGKAGREGPAAGVTTETDLIAIQQVMEGIGPEWVGGMLFHEDGHIEPVILSYPVERSGASQLYAVQFSRDVVKSGDVLKVVVFSGTTFEVPIGKETQSVEVIASGDGDVLVATEDQVVFLNPKGDQSGSPIQVEQIVLAQT